MPKKLGLDKAVKKILAERGGKPLEHRFVEPATADYLLGKLRLPKEKLEKAKELAAHNTRLLEASACAERQVPISVKSVRKIIETTLEEIPAFMERNKSRLGEKQMTSLRLLQRNLGNDLKKLEGTPGELPSGLAPAFLETARNIHFDELEHLIGEKNFRLYKNAMRRTMKVVRERKR